MQYCDDRWHTSVYSDTIKHLCIRVPLPYVYIYEGDSMYMTKMDPSSLIITLHDDITVYVSIGNLAREW